MHLIAIVLGALVGVLVGFLGVGGGVVLIPLLTLAFHVDMRYANGFAIGWRNPVAPVFPDYRDVRTRKN